jgi:hypothetical protein
VARHQQRGGAQLEGRRKAFDDRLGDPLLVLEGTAQVSLDRTREPGDVLHGDRLVEPELGADLRHRDGIAVLARKDEHGIGRREARECEDANGHEKRHGDHEYEATEDVCDHSVASVLIG